MPRGDNTSRENRNLRRGNIATGSGRPGTYFVPMSRHALYYCLNHDLMIWDDVEAVYCTGCGASGDLTRNGGGIIKPTLECDHLPQSYVGFLTLI